jgi:hypothetical protein
MGSQLVAIGKTKKGTDYRIYNIDNTYTIYLFIENQLDPENKPGKPVYSAVKSFSTLKDAKEYADKTGK